jgi:flagellar hook-associated protein FlgK
MDEDRVILNSTPYQKSKRINELSEELRSVNDQMQHLLSHYRDPRTHEQMRNLKERHDDLLSELNTLRGINYS